MPANFDWDQAIYLVILLIAVLILNRGVFSRWRGRRDDREDR